MRKAAPGAGTTVCVHAVSERTEVRRSEYKWVRSGYEQYHQHERALARLCWRTLKAPPSLARLARLHGDRVYSARRSSRSRQSARAQRPVRPIEQSSLSSRWSPCLRASGAIRVSERWQSCAKAFVGAALSAPFALTRCAARRLLCSRHWWRARLPPVPTEQTRSPSAYARTHAIAVIGVIIMIYHEWRYLFYWVARDLDLRGAGF